MGERKISTVPEKTPPASSVVPGGEPKQSREPPQTTSTQTPGYPGTMTQQSGPHNPEKLNKPHYIMLNLQYDKKHHQEYNYYLE